MNRLFKRTIRRHHINEYLKTKKRFASPGIPNVISYLFSSSVKALDTELLNAKRVFQKYSVEKTEDTDLLLNVQIVRSSCTKTKASKAKLGLLTDSLGSMLFSIDAINSSSIETHAPSSGTSLFSSSLRAKIIAQAARCEALGLDFEKTKFDFYKTTASISGPKGTKED